MKTTTTVTLKRGRVKGTYITNEGDYALVNDSRNCWIIIPVVNEVVQYGSWDEVFVYGDYTTAKNYISTVREQMAR